MRAHTIIEGAPPLRLRSKDVLAARARPRRASRLTWRDLEAQNRALRKRNAELEIQLGKPTKLQRELGKAEHRIGELEIELGKTRGALYAAGQAAQRLEAIADRLEALSGQHVADPPEATA